MNAQTAIDDSIAKMDSLSVALAKLNMNNESAILVVANLNQAEE